MKKSKSQFILVTDDITAGLGAHSLNRGINIRIYTGNKSLETEIPYNNNIAINYSAEIQILKQHLKDIFKYSKK